MTSDSVKWRAWAVVHKYSTSGRLYEIVPCEGNLLMYGGASAVWERLIGTGVTAYDAANAYIGVGDGQNTADPGQTDLQGVFKARKGMDLGYPIHADDLVTTSTTVTFRSSFGEAEANFTWWEWGVFNAASGGRMLNRKVTSFGVKPVGTTWTITVSLSLA